MYIESLEICIGMFIATALIRGNTNDKSKLHAMFYPRILGLAVKLTTRNKCKCLS